MGLLKPILNNIPEELQKRNQFVTWLEIERDGKLTKPPYTPGGQLASVDDSHTWSTYEAVKKVADRFDGIGFVLTKDDPFIGIDFDKCYCPAFGIIDPAIEQYLKSINTYTEISPSGKGLRGLLKGKLPVDGRKNGRIEIYQAGRYVTLTGHILPGYPASIEIRQAELDAFYKAAFPEKPADPKQTPPNVSPGTQINWQERLQVAFRSKNGNTIKQLYDGDTSGYPSPSEADMAFCSHLAFWFAGDVTAIDQAFRASKLYRAKLDKKHGEKTYGQMTIDKALEGCKEFYQDPLRNSQEGTRSQNKRPRGAKGLSLDDIDECFSQPVSYLFKKHIPNGMPIIIAGREGIGKTSIVIGICNEILKDHPKGIIVWIASEGFVQDTIDKMQKLGSDRKRLIILQNENGTFQFAFDRISDRNQLDNYLSDCKATGRVVLAVVMDSIRGISHFGDNDSEIKNVMIPLNSIVCDKHKATLFYIDHEKKGIAPTLLDKVSGSPAKAAAVRRVFSVVSVSPFVRKVVMSKSNIFDTPPPDLMAALSNNKLTIYETADVSETSLIGQAEQWLIKIFSEKGEYRASDIYTMGEKYGFGVEVLKKAKGHLKIGSELESVGKPWVWKCSTFLNTDPLLYKNRTSRENEELWQK